MKGPIIILILQLLFATNHGQDCSSIKEAQIPNNISDFVNKQFPTFQIANNNDFIDNWCYFYSDTLISPYYVTGDFDNDKNKEFCLIIKSQDRKDYKIIIIDNENKVLKAYTVIQTPDPYRQYWLDNYKFDFGLELSKPVSITDATAEKHVNIISEFVKVIAFEKSERIIYWTGYKYETIFNGD
jgi:hypothetical protein